MRGVKIPELSKIMRELKTKELKKLLRYELDESTSVDSDEEQDDPGVPFYYEELEKCKTMKELYKFAREYDLQIPRIDKNDIFLKACKELNKNNIFDPNEDIIFEGVIIDPVVIG
ncbi:V2 [Sputnik virophage]|uniref:Uncharacterized protein V2 n=3 Tax=Mimivirus-dependent virus Sputnik TaxID=1932927 RepID=V2_SPTNK|nr:V2 [Sputnik virophage]B4YNE2.1 RecName: Full=Uncharacterized protein V2 [Sputnik virophage]AFH75256.1 hypothetical protein Sputnik2_R2 [Sputnik virophage 2]AFH75276.1 hypothetical protein Sputnik3_R2 [Sputnik virophage 3]UMZ08514.1 hypothetical protein [Mimivirus-dependent virus Sputnik]ACF16986.1 V2 [Sputnik virophage]AUG84989.1 hypothetical protein [Sputnik virophage 2]